MLFWSATRVIFSAPPLSKIKIRDHLHMRTCSHTLSAGFFCSRNMSTVEEDRFSPQNRTSQVQKRPLCGCWPFNCMQPLGSTSQSSQPCCGFSNGMHFYSTEVVKVTVGPMGTAFSSFASPFSLPATITPNSNFKIQQTSTNLWSWQILVRNPPLRK
jgi:hypothetical protein